MIGVQYLRKDGKDIFNRKAMEMFDDTPRVYLISYESVIAVADYSVDGGALYITNEDCLLSHTTAAI